MKQMLIVGLLIVVFAMSGCSTPKTPDQPNPNPSTGNLGIKMDVEISGFAFNPSTVTAPKGATVIWTNKDSAPHTIVSDTGSEISSESLSTGNTYAHTFNTPGTYAYHCSIHPSMKGTVIVE
jgi:plastocyanin